MGKDTSKKRGATLVEAAAVVLLLFTFIFAIVEFGRVLSVYQTITNAAREGARFSVAPCQSGDPAKPMCSYAGNQYPPGSYPSEAAIRAYVQSYLKAGSVAADSVVIESDWPTVSGSFGGNPFSLKYYYRYVTVTTTYRWLIFPFGNLTLKANSVMKGENDLQP
jgi:hypothetical protein